MAERRRRRQVGALSGLALALMAVLAGVSAAASRQVSRHAPVAIVRPSSRPVPSLWPTPVATPVSEANRRVPDERPSVPAPPAVEASAARARQEPSAPPAPAKAQDLLVMGEELFARRWQENDPRSHGGDGLGPVYNADSCLACHGLVAPGGAGPVANNVQLVTVPTAPTTIPRWVDRLGHVHPRHLVNQEEWAKVHPAFRASPTILLHRFGVAPSYPQVREVLLRRGYHLTKSPFGNGIRALSERNSPALFGVGRIDALPDSVLIQAAERGQLGEIHGRVNRLPDGRIGRFGWKAQIATLEEFVRLACANELGLEVPGRSQALAPHDSEYRPKGLDMTDEEVKALVAYVRSLPVPESLHSAEAWLAAEIESGRRLFTEVGCAACHVPNLGDIEGIYSDLLLHDMGGWLSEDGSYYAELEASRQGRTPKAAQSSEWRTPPLWGFRDSAPYLHDGRAATLDEAVAQHEGEAREACLRFFALKDPQRLQVLAFLNSLAVPKPPDHATTHHQAPAPCDEEYYITRHRHDVRARAREALGQRLDESPAAGLIRKLRTARNLESLGKRDAALSSYRAIARQDPESTAGKQAAARARALEASAKTPAGPNP